MNQSDLTALAATLATVDPRQTIRPPSLQTTMAAPALGPIAAKLDRIAERLELKGTIGQGGMAIVRSARQTSLGREVAVKTLRADATSDAAPRLLREAWITGALEHPNIVPLHDLGADEGGRPLLVLKRIEGEPWRIENATLERNLAILMQVCHAIAFAHSRGIVHRDLKPANIMIGGFGEVYVLDWGIAVSLLDDGSGRLPLAADCHEIGGTLAYMAPEMLGSAPLTERTDTFLLGAILYEIIEGKPPHLRESVAAALASIRQCAPTFHPDAPAELVAICKRALAPDPVARYATADELRLALAAFLEHRSSAQIARESEERLRELEAQLAAAAAPDAPDASRVTMYQLFGQCRFGFQAALRAWPGNTAARVGLDRALEIMASHELDNGDARGAAVLIAELSRPRQDLADRLARVERDATEKRRRLERFEADQDVSAGGLTRTFFLVLIGVAWSTLPIFADVFPAVTVNHGASLIVACASLAGVIGFAYWARESMLKTAVNRGVLLTVIVGLILHSLVEALAWATGMDMATTHMVALALWAGATGTAAVFIDRALVVPTLAFLGAVVTTAVWPDRRFWAISGSCAVLLSTVVYTRYFERRGRIVFGLAQLFRRGD